MGETTKELNGKVAALRCGRVVEALRKRNFEAHFMESIADAAKFVVDAARGAKTVGFGGSKTIAEIGVNDALTAAGCELVNHGDPSLTPEQRAAALQRQQFADLFLCSANALTMDGVIVNIDGAGNRVSATIFGPKRVIMVVGRNKLVDGDFCDAIRRVKALASPPNTMRLGKATPCAKTGVCADCSSPDRICNVISIFERKPTRIEFCVLVVNEDLGF